MRGHKAITTVSPCKLSRANTNRQYDKYVDRSIRRMIRSMAQDGVREDQLDIMVSNAHASGHTWVTKPIIRRVINGYR